MADTSTPAKRAYTPLPGRRILAPSLDAYTRSIRIVFEQTEQLEMIREEIIQSMK